jgi:hypothetical protein
METGKYMALIVKKKNAYMDVVEKLKDKDRFENLDTILSMILKRILNK